MHEIDLVRWLFGEDIVATNILKPRRSSKGSAELHDPLIVLLEMASGVLVDVEVFVNATYGYDIRGEIVGERGTVALAEAGGTVLKQEGRRSSSVPADWRERFSRAYDVELQDWLKAVAAGSSTGPSSWDGYAASGRGGELPRGAADREPHGGVPARAPGLLREGAVRPVRSQPASYHGFSSAKPG